jgi:hypothetical protein
MERDIKGWHRDATVDEAFLNQLAKAACKAWSVKILPEIYIENKRTVDIAWCTEDGIYLNTYRDGVNYAVLIHELAHWICDDRHGTDMQPHSPEWADIYLDLLDRFHFLPRWLGVQLFAAHGIQF